MNDGFEPHYCSALPCKVEYGGINTVLRRSYERLLRKLLMLPHRPAVLMLQTFDYSERWVTSSLSPPQPQLNLIPGSLIDRRSITHHCPSTQT